MGLPVPPPTQWNQLQLQVAWRFNRRGLCRGLRSCVSSVKEASGQGLGFRTLSAVWTYSNGHDRRRSRDASGWVGCLGRRTGRELGFRHGTGQHLHDAGGETLYQPRAGCWSVFQRFLHRIKRPLILLFFQFSCDSAGSDGDGIPRAFHLSKDAPLKASRKS